MLAALALSSALVAAAADPEVDRLRGYMAEARGHGGVMYRLAQALARAGQADEAVLWVKSALDQGLDLDLGDAAFASLREREDWKEQLARTDAVKPVATSRLAFRISDPELIPEGIAWDPKTGDFFVGSLYKKKIVRVDREGRARDFTTTGQDGLEDVLGLTVDAPRRTLWACTAASGRAGPGAGRSGLLAYDLDSGTLRRAAWLDNKDGRHLVNDVAVTAAGEAYVTDSDAATLWKLGVGATALEVFVGPGTLLYPNGLALSVDEKRLYVADFKHGLSTVDLASKAPLPLPHPDGVSTYGIDGLYRVGSDLVAVQNGAGRERIVRYRLDAKGERIDGLEVLESRNPLFRTPTTGVVEGEAFVYLANPNLEALDEDGTLKKGAHLEGVAVLRAPLR
jgi:DNA-binding beta-propeller fold protein YncE